MHSTRFSVEFICIKLRVSEEVVAADRSTRRRVMLESASIRLMPQELSRMSSWESGKESGSAAEVIPQHAAESLTARDVTGCAAHFGARFDDPVVEPLMVSFRVIMGDEFLGGVGQRSITEENHAVKAFFFYGSNETFQMCRQIRGPGREANATGANLLNYVAKRLAMLGVSVHEQVALVAQESIQRVGEVAADLHHPGFGGMAGAAGQLHTTSGRFEHKQQIEGNEPSLGQDLDGSEIDGGQDQTSEVV